MKFQFARVVVIVTGLVPACSSSRVEKIAPLTFEVLGADTPRTTAQGTSFVAPKDWKIAVRGAATLLEPPEAGSRMALVDVDAKDADAAVAAAWAAYGGQTRKLKMSSARANREGWNDTRFYFYET